MNVIVEENQSIFCMRFLLATTVYEHSCQRDPVCYFYYVFLSTHDNVWPLLSNKFNLYCFLLYALPTNHDHVWTLLSKISRLFSYYVFLASHGLVWTFLSEWRSLWLFFFYYVLPASHDHENMTVLVQEVQSILLFIICFQLATTMNALIIQEVRSNFYFGIFKLFLCVSI